MGAVLFYLGDHLRPLRMGLRLVCALPTGPMDVNEVVWTARLLVGKAGFEPAASASRTLRAAKLRYFPCRMIVMGTWSPECPNRPNTG